jgi:hypothetical protein
MPLRAAALEDSAFAIFGGRDGVEIWSAGDIQSGGVRAAKTRDHVPCRHGPLSTLVIILDYLNDGSSLYARPFGNPSLFLCFVVHKHYLFLVPSNLYVKQHICCIFMRSAR